MAADYSKPPLSVDEQIALLRKRGMSFQDPSSAKAILARINFYRLRGYWITFENPDDPKHLFRDETRFEDVLNLYFFDEQLRQILLMHLGKLEISLKTTFSYYFSHAKGPLSYREQEHFKNVTSFEVCKCCKQIIKKNNKGWNHATSLRKLDETFNKSYELFAEKLKDTYSYPPIWEIVEVMTYGEIVRWYRALNIRHIREKLTNIHNFTSFPVFARFIHSANVLRNICAHHSRIVNRTLGVRPRKPNDTLRNSCGWVDENWVNDNNIRPGTRAYNLLALLNHALKTSQGHIGFRANLEGLSEKYKISLHVLGFPQDWQSFPVWADPQQ